MWQTFLQEIWDLTIKKFKSLVLLLLVWLLLAITGFYLLKCLKFPIQTTNDFLLYITFLAIVWYSWETKKLREETSFQKHLNVYPLLTVQMIDAKRFAIVNIGKGPAMYYKAKGDYSPGVKFFSYSKVLPPISDDSNAKIFLFEITVGEESINNYQIKKSKNSGIKPQRKNFSSGMIKITYEDLFGIEYVSKIIFTPVGPRLEKYEILRNQTQN